MEREPLFDQMICNYYEPGQGITPHVDILSKFADGNEIEKKKKERRKCY